MQKPTFYRILSFILLPIAALFGLLDLIVLLTALSNPPMLLPVFMLACVAIYVFSSFSFLNKGIIQNKPRKASLKDWIKVNAIVAAVFSVLGLINVVVVLNDPAILTQLIDQALSMQGNPNNVPKETMLNTMRGVLYFLGQFLFSF